MTKQELIDQVNTLIHQLNSIDASSSTEQIKIAIGLCCDLLSAIHDEIDRLRTDPNTPEFQIEAWREIRTPLNSTIGYLSLIRDDVYDTDQEAQEFLFGAKQSVKAFQDCLMQLDF